MATVIPSGLPQNTRFRVHRWLDTATMTARYGIQACRQRRWLNCSEAGKALLFDTMDDAERKIAAVRAALARHAEVRADG